MSSFVCRCLMSGVWRRVWRRASHEDVVIVGNFLDDFQFALAWIPSGAPEDVFDVVFQEYLGYAREDFHATLLCMEERNGVTRWVRLQRAVNQGLVYYRAAAVRRCDLYVPFEVTGEAAI